jgi:hypothetical protein
VDIERLGFLEKLRHRRNLLLLVVAILIFYRMMVGQISEEENSAVTLERTI